MKIDRALLLQTFLDETNDVLSAMEKAVTVLEEKPGDDESLGAIFRGAHTLKGNAVSFGFSHISDLAHVLEDLLEQLRNRNIDVSSDLATLMLRVVDAFREMVPKAVAGEEHWGPAFRDLLDELSRASGESPNNTGATEARTSNPVDDQKEAAASSPAEAPQRAQSLRVGLDKLDRLLDLTGEVCIARGQITQMLEDPALTQKAILEAQREADFLYMELQELVVNVRMVPVGPIFQHHFRTVRDLAHSHGKLAHLVIEGDDVEVDSRVIEQLRDPLTHMIRNAIDHGIEPPAERRAAGKDPRGRLTLRAFHDAGTIVIELEDDGAGIDPERLVERARSLGMAVEGLSRTQIHELIFAPGFSTAVEVTDLSGRGVGMDVVRRNIDALRGTVSISSEKGRGTKLSIRLPLTMAIIEGFQLGVGPETYILPVESVVETVEFHHSQHDGRGWVKLHDQSLPFVRLRDLFHIEGAAPSRESLVVVRYEGAHAGLVIDALLGLSQTVIKPLGKLLQGLPGVSGSAILGSGRVAFILDVPTLLSKSRTRTTHSALLAETNHLR